MYLTGPHGEIDAIVRDDARENLADALGLKDSIPDLLVRDDEGFRESFPAKQAEGVYELASDLRNETLRWRGPNPGRGVM